MSHKLGANDETMTMFIVFFYETKAAVVGKHLPTSRLVGRCLRMKIPVEQIQALRAIFERDYEICPTDSEIREYATLMLNLTEVVILKRIRESRQANVA